MLGHQSLLDLRMAGYRPSSVFVWCCDKQPVFTSSFDHPDSRLKMGSFPELLVLPDESAELLDMRVLHGLVVHINAGTQERGEAVMRRAAEFTPEKIICAGDWGMLGWKPERGFVRFKL